MNTPKVPEVVEIAKEDLFFVLGEHYIVILNSDPFSLAEPGGDDLVLGDETEDELDILESVITSINEDETPSMSDAHVALESVYEQYAINLAKAHTAMFLRLARPLQTNKALQKEFEEYMREHYDIEKVCLLPQSRKPKLSIVPNPHAPKKK